MKRVRLTDVARDAGVSSATASLVLNDREARISEDTRQRVRDVADRLGYAPNTVARGLRLGSTKTVGLISDTIATTPYAGKMLAGAEEVARAHGNLVFIVNTELDQAAEREAIAGLVNHQVDAIVYATMFHRVIRTPGALPPSTVLLDCRAEDDRFPAVVPDEIHGGRDAARVLLDAGHVRIAYVDVEEEHPPVAREMRYEGFVAELATAGITHDPAFRVHERLAGTRGSRAIGRLLDLPHDERPTAVFCFNDRTALGVYAAARHRGLAIARDLSVVGFDDQVLVAEELEPALTTVALPHREMGRWAMEVALGVRSHDASLGPHLEHCPVVHRESVGPPPPEDGRRRT